MSNGLLGFRSVTRILSLLVLLAAALASSDASAGRRAGQKPNGVARIWLSSPQAAVDPADSPRTPGQAKTATELDARAAVLPGEIVEWEVSVRVRGRNDGLALFSVDLIQDSSNPELFDLPAGGPPATGFEPLNRPLGFANPAPDPYGSGFGGTPVAASHGFANLRQIGGAVNTFGLTPRCVGHRNDICQGQEPVPARRMARAGRPTLVASGSFPAPETPGVYVFHIERVAAGVLVKPARIEKDGPVIAARAVLEVPSFTIAIAAPNGEALVSSPPSTDVLARATAEVVRPAPDAVLTATHVRFWWPDFRTDGGYALVLVEDDGSPNPFLSQRDAVRIVPVPKDAPRALVTEGLEFGTSYAWKVTDGSAAAPEPRRAGRSSS